MGYYAFADGMGLAVGHGEHIRYTWRVSIISVQFIEWISIPVVLELIWIPTPFLKASAVHCANAFIHASYADLIGTESDNVSMLDMCCIDNPIFFFMTSLQKNPERGE